MSEKNKLATLSEQQQNPYAARGEDFPIMTAEDAAKKRGDGFGQRDGVEAKDVRKPKPETTAAPKATEPQDAARPRWKWSKNGDDRKY